MANKIFIASDHAGYDLKEAIVNSSVTKGCSVVDLGTDSSEKSVDYPDYAFKLTSEIEKDKDSLGILVCGSGIGISIAANRNKSARAALCTSVEMAQLCRAHNNANILCLGARITGESEALNIVTEFLKSTFAGGRHTGRVSKLSN